MRQKAIWMPLLLIGILNSFQSCKGEISEINHTEYCFINESDHVIGIEAFSYELTDSSYFHIINNDIDVYRLPHGKTFCQWLEVPNEKRNKVLIGADSVVVTFGDSVEARFLPRRYLQPDTTHQPFNILHVSNYTQFMKADNHTYLEYVFTNDDYENAL